LVNSVKRVLRAFMITVFILLFFVPIILSTGTVAAQGTGYGIDKVDHSIEIMFSGQVVIRDTIHVSGQITNTFMIGLPSKYSGDVLKAVAYDTNNAYEVNTGVQLGNRSGFYGAEVNFNGNSPDVFTIAFILSSSVLTFDQSTGSFTLDFPAYPSLPQDVATANVSITLPNNPSKIVITKSDGEVDGDNYITQNIAAYTYSVGSANFQIAAGTLVPTVIDQLNRQINLDPTGKVTISDNYHITNNGTGIMTSFVFNLPTTASSIIVKDEFGRTLTTDSSSTVRDIRIANATLISFLTSGQSTFIALNYNLPGATIQGSQYALSNFTLFPDFFYYVEHATFTFTPPEGATIVTPKLSTLDSSSSLSRDAFQDSFTINRGGLSYVDYSVPESKIVQFSYDYNPIWVSFRPTFWGSLLAVILCVGAVFYRRSKPGEKEPVIAKMDKAVPKVTASTKTEQVKEVQAVTGQRITTDNLKEFTEAYEEKKQLNTELKSMDARAQKGKIPRRQYKVQRRAVEVRLETLARNINKLKETLRNSSSAYADLVKQLDSAEEDLAAAEENIKKLELQQNRGEISIEKYKENIGDYQKRKDKAESTMNGILLRLREKAR